MSLTRHEAVVALMGAFSTDVCFVTGLGYISREFYGIPEVRHRCLPCMGSMGSVFPFALGMAMVRADRQIVAVEGDGSLLMNLGCLATLKRYGVPNLWPVVFDNGVYESTGGQPSRTPDLDLAAFCSSFGIESRTAITSPDIEVFTKESAGPLKGVLVVKVKCGPPAPRISTSPGELARGLQAFWEN